MSHLVPFLYLATKFRWCFASKVDKKCENVVKYLAWSALEILGRQGRCWYEAGAKRFLWLKKTSLWLAIKTTCESHITGNTQTLMIWKALQDMLIITLKCCLALLHIILANARWIVCKYKWKVDYDWESFVWKIGSQ